MLVCTAPLFPRFTALAEQFELEDVLPPATPAEIASIELELRVPLPASYKLLLSCTRGFRLLDGVVQFGEQHPFFHEFESLESLSPAQQQMVQRKGGKWPPPSNGMLCFAEFFLEADGDQVLFDVSRGLAQGEYPVMYYSHESRPPQVRVLEPSFTQFMEAFLQYDAFGE